jgi:hypothetical protein
MKKNLAGTNPSIEEHSKAPQVDTPKWEKGSTGEDNPRHILIAAQVLDIYASDEPQAILAKRYGVHKNTISMIRTGRRWAWLTQAQAEAGAA